MIKKLDESYYSELYSLEEEIFSYHQKMRPDLFKEIPFSKEIYHTLVHHDQYAIYGYFLEEELVVVIYVNKRENFYYIDDIVVKSIYQNQGIASTLFKYVEQMALKEGIDRIELDVWSFNEKAIEFYQKNGYTPKTIRYEKILKKERKNGAASE